MKDRKIFIVDVYFNFRDNTGSTQHAFLVEAPTKTVAMSSLMTYLENSGYFTSRIDRFDITLLKFTKSHVLRMRS